ncbi:ATP-binding cassette domain-containing protein [Pseudoroseomonas wenyumeiae]|uniref:ABC transporter ATP-binding protein n=1 Tax=Teichococcus wenyumeiae TaxID=2478470 RepID=A0A3A9JI96_9PROT|nr:ABC transporter ATP-binding protein [Pseudoroseomonas wenyumeiae]RMI19768.1 ATP-binding cassette domain-containing protein [Pseudoroseomonas wenyumeiae]
MPDLGETVLELRGLRTEFQGDGPPAVAVQDLSFTVRRGETLCIVGESGCGKSMTALSLLRLVPRPGGRIAAGEAILGGRDLLALSDAEMRAVRGGEIAMIFQEPMTSLNPVLTIGRQIAETVMVHEQLPWAACMDHALAMLRQVRMPEPERRLHEYPHQLSGGMRQRVMIAMALACRPRLLLADEPTTALDVTIQAQILDLIGELQQETGAAVILITHDLGVVAEMADRVVVMYAGRKVEEAAVERLFEAPLHPYTRGLMAAMPHLGGVGVGRRRLAEIPGVVPALTAMPPGCPFAPRCERATGECHQAMPPLGEEMPGRLVACWHPGEGEFTRHA